MTRRQPIIAVTAFVLLSSWIWLAAGQVSRGAAPAPSPESDQPALGDLMQRTSGEPVLLTEPQRYGACNVSFGWWGAWSNGSPAKTGEYQDWSSSPFWRVDQFSSDGTRTFGLTATGTDNETTAAKVYYYQPGLSAKVDYDRFLHRLDHDPLNNMPDTTPAVVASTASDPKIIKQDLSVGQDYALRVQELNASFKWLASDNLKVRLDLWSMQKDGVRQANAIAMCYNRPGTTPLPPDHLGVGGANLGVMGGNRCHVLSQPQQIDWITTEIKPVVEFRLGDALTFEYARPMRGFTDDDQLATRFYSGTGQLTYNTTTNTHPYEYGVAPNSYTQMDQLKIGAELSDDTKAYAYLMIGNTTEREISMTRWFNDMDLRLTNTSIDNVTLTGYGTVFNEDEESASAAAVGQANRQTGTALANALPTDALIATKLPFREPFDYHRETAGMKGVWRPWGRGFGLGGLAVVAGYEYCDLDRKNAIYSMTSTPAVVSVDESHTITNGFQIGPDMRWSPCFDTYLRYKFQNADQPLIGFARDNGQYNTLLPQRDNIVEIGGSWLPSEQFMLNASLGLENSENHSQYANFGEQNYPFNINAWYAVTDRFSISGGYAIYSNFVAQNITAADQLVFPTGAGSVAPATGRWTYGGRAEVVNLGSRYCVSERVRLTGEIEYVRGQDLITSSTFTTLPTVTDLGSFSQVLNQTTRLTLGLDYVIRPRIINYYRYELYDFLDKAPGYQTGTAHGLLGGLSAIF